MDSNENKENIKVIEAEELNFQEYPVENSDEDIVLIDPSIAEVK